MVDLTEEEKELAITEARVKKTAVLEDQRKKRLAIQKMNDLRRPWTPNELYEYARKRATDIIRLETGNHELVFEPKPFQKPAITALALYFSNNLEFEKLNPSEYNDSGLSFSLNKGIWLWSNPGQGKTLMMHMFCRNKRQCYQVIQCPKLANSYIKYGDEIIEPYSQIFPETEDSLSFYQRTKGICYNDLGVETCPVKHYANPLNVMESIFLNTYENKIPFNQRHVTTNLTGDQLREMYGVRFVDRVKQSFNIIQIKGESLRK